MKRKGALAVLALAALGAVWAFWLEPRALVVREHELAVPGWPIGCDGLRIAVLTDVHTGSPFNGPGKLDRIVDETNSARPDLVLLAGDYVIHGVIGGTFYRPEATAERLARLTARGGVFAVLGNHDWWLDAERVAAALGAVDIPLLEDASAEVAIDGCSFALAGVSDYMEGAHDVARALSAIPPETPTIAFTHNPDIFPAVPSTVALTVAGHTHGGQVWLPLLGRPIVPSEYGQRFAAGHIVENGRHLFVATGLGTSILPVRFFVPPEISVLVLRSRE